MILTSSVKTKRISNLDSSLSNEIMKLFYLIYHLRQKNVRPVIQDYKEISH